MNRRQRSWGVWLGCLLFASGVGAQECHRAVSNPQNSGACQTISSTAVTVMAANTGRCSALIHNSSANDMFCRDVDTDGPPTATTGTLIKAGQALALGREGVKKWQCIRVASDATACVTEGRP